MENMEVKEIKKFNKANLPFFIALGMFIGLLVLPIIAFIFYVICFSINSNLAAIPLGGVLIFGLIAVPSIPLLCIIGLILQILHKEKNKFDKIMLALNSAAILMMVLLVIFAYIAFPNALVKDEDVKAQIDTEFATLNKEYQPVLDYLAMYKKKNGVYPDKIDAKVLPKSETFDKYVYHVASDKKGYWLEVYPINAPIEFYFNDEYDNGYEYYKGTGTIDSAFTNYNYYEIDKKWHAVHQDLVTRHSRFVKNKAERDTDIYFKDNIDKYNFNADKK